MKIIKKLAFSILTILSLTLCLIFSACTNSEIVENDRADKSGVGEWEWGLWVMTSAPTRLGVGFSYEFDGATIETGILSDRTILVIMYKTHVLNNWEDLSGYEHYSSLKKASSGDCPLMSSDVAAFQWAADMWWWDWKGLAREEQELSDYITFIARKDNNIVGYAVMYVYVSGLKGGGEVIVDKEFPQVNGKYQKVSEITVKEKINEVIELHKALAD